MSRRRSKAATPAPSTLGRWAVRVAIVALVVVPPWAARDTQAENSPLAPLASPASLAPPGPPQDYVIGPLDKLSIKVFKVPDLSQNEVLVDANGQVNMPLIGEVTAAGKTAQQLASEIAERLGAQYLQSPQVSVAVEESVSRKVTLEGEVKLPGVYQMKGRITLMQAVAMAGGMAEDANYKKVAVIRTVDGVRKVAVCDFSQISRAQIPDPEIQGDDVIIVDGSRTKMFWSATMKSLPLFSLLAITI